MFDCTWLCDGASTCPGCRLCPHIAHWRHLMACRYQWTQLNSYQFDHLKNTVSIKVTYSAVKGCIQSYSYLTSAPCWSTRLTQLTHKSGYLNREKMWMAQESLHHLSSHVLTIFHIRILFSTLPFKLHQSKKNPNFYRSQWGEGSIK